ncbi:MAG: 50S ribosomal protein L11 methyltransferase [Rhodospirillales bacterium]|nr:50S ribosomal protein L11 methyltransferase [Rhodospirillales bacterium]
MSDLRLARLAVPKSLLPAADEVAISAGATIWADLEGDSNPVVLELTLPPELDAAALEAGLAVLFEAFGQPLPALTLEALPDKDWLAEVHRSLPALSAGRFYVYGRHVTDPPPPDLIALQVEAALAFGSGHHQSTQGCLELLSVLAPRRDLHRILDMGCGSGILALAAAKLWPCRVLAIDIHAKSVEIARGNAALNGVAERVEAVESDGYRHPAIAAPYDLILANILARPLIAFAPDLGRHLAPGGLAILAGLLAREAEAVLSAHEAAGLRLKEARNLGEWQCLLLEKG